MKLVKFEPVKHYAILSNWWAQHGWATPALDHLPTASGFIVEGRNGPIAAGFVYFTGTAFCLFEWIVAAPNAGMKEKAQALDVLISGVKMFCLAMGVKTIFMSMKHDGLIGKLEKDHGFQRTDENMTNLIGKV